MFYMVQSSDQRFLLVSAVINKPFPRWRISCPAQFLQASVYLLVGM